MQAVASVDLCRPHRPTGSCNRGHRRRDRKGVTLLQKETVLAQYAVLIYADDSVHHHDASPADTESCDRHADELARDGSMLVAYALTPRAMAKSLRSDGVTHGPFVEARHVVAGFYVIEAPDLDAALAIAGTNPAISEGGGVEVRPVHSGGTVERTEP